ncbi:MAG: O-antigen ligase family protein [Kiritimatiellia bacterium]
MLALRVLCCNIPVALAVTEEVNAASEAFAPLLEQAFARGSMSERTFAGLSHSLARPSFLFVLFDRGELGDSQRLMAGLVGAVAIVLSRDKTAGGHWAFRLRFPVGGPVALRVWPILAGLTSLALLLTFKRSSWLAALAVLVFLCFRRIPWKKGLLGLVALAVVVAAIPATRVRMASLFDEFDPQNGGRVVMWTKVAPAVMREHPGGIGFRAMTPERMREFAGKANVRHVEPRRYHLHSNPVEMATSTGWAGLAIYLAWLVLAFRDVRRIDRGRPPESRGLAPALGGMLAALVLNGLVEYNFADGELVLAYGLLMGSAAGLAGKPAARSSESQG